MHLTLHLTEACNMSCVYCAQTHSSQSMSIQTACAAVDFALDKNNQSQQICDSGFTGISFFGGEPLLQRNVIEKVVEYCSKITESNGAKFKFSVTTNGVLLDESFLEFAVLNSIRIDLSHDGLMHHSTRHMSNGSSSFACLDERINLLLKHLPNSAVLCTFSPDYVEQLPESVDWLFDRGFNKVFTVPAIGDHIHWTEEKLNHLKNQFFLLSDMYIERTRRGERFSLPLFDVKIMRQIMKNTISPMSCDFGIKKYSIVPDGNIYPCLQFLHEEEFKIGHIFSGIDQERVDFVIEAGKKEASECQMCALKSRCRFNCCCQNKLLTGQIDVVSPFTCAFEKMTIEVADRTANILFNEKNPNFLRRHYHVSIED